MVEVEVTGLSDEVDTEHLTLYFENKRISGGGPLLSCTRDGTEATLTFQNLTDAERVLSKSEHKVSTVILHLRRPAPWDPGKLALCGLNPNTSDVLLEIYVENVSEREKFCIQRSTDGTTALVIFQEPLSETGKQTAMDKKGINVHIQNSFRGRS
ncbi:protein mono-ADP-ribosyltransferase PARP10-like [Bombina bombina]|uniref:protein mono-ADP-ribosyltransferase PARP10-like n=1 Tax=Bombina bombina TaxID=8345 RepID=UPI00235A8CA6|nr:protein mono-ADP-ribosyltransferase PARP10-like [Bombina bombina]